MPILEMLSLKAQKGVVTDPSTRSKETATPRLIPGQWTYALELRRGRALGSRLPIWREGLDFVSLVLLGLLGAKTLEGSQPGVHRRLMNNGTPVALQNLLTGAQGTTWCAPPGGNARDCRRWGRLAVGSWSWSELTFSVC